MYLQSTYILIYVVHHLVMRQNCKTHKPVCIPSGAVNRINRVQ